MSTPAAPASPSRFLDQTHEVINVSSELAGYNMYTQDAALREAVQREGAAWAQADLTVEMEDVAAILSFAETNNCGHYFI